MRGVAGLSAVRWTSRRKSAHPYQAQSITDALAALPPDHEPTVPVPTFTARQPMPDRDTRPHPALAVTPDTPDTPVPPGADLAVLTRVRDAMKAKFRTESFIADKRELPLFAALTRELGWQGLHMPPQPARWQRWSTSPWFAREQELTNAAYLRARAMVLGELDDVRTRADDAFSLVSGAR